MKNCSLCSGAKNFYYGFEGKRYSDKKVMLILNHPDERVNTSKDYRNVLADTPTGKVLREMLYYSGLEFEDVYITNSVKCVFPDRTPKKEEYSNCKLILKKQIGELKPNSILLFGEKPYKKLFSENRKKNLADVIGNEMEFNGVPCLINLHPSKIWALIGKDRKAVHYRRVRKFLDKYDSLGNFHEQKEINF